MTTPPKPATFAPDAAPPGVEYRHVEFARPKLRSPARILLIHTNAARGEGSIESAWNWAHSAPNQRTCPTYQVDLGGGARKMLDSDEDAIANCTINDYQDGHGDVSEWSQAIETADTGTDDDPTISAFTEAQIETIATIVAYEHLVPGNEIPLDTPTEWYGAGVAGHTDPFGYPLWTCKRGKICPGDKKKAQIRNVILPRAREIVAAWRAPADPPQPPEEDSMFVASVAHTDSANPYKNGGVRLGNGIHQRRLQTWGEVDQWIARYVSIGRPLVNLQDGKEVTTRDDITLVADATLLGRAV